MYLIQLLLPLYDNEKRPIMRAEFENVRNELTDQFGGVTAFVRSPAVGLWQEDDAELIRDDVVMFEVMVETLDARWWSDYRQRIEKRFKQEELIVRAISMTKL